MTRVLVTGGTGFVGRQIITGLRERGAEAIVRGEGADIRADLLAEGAAERLLAEARPDIVVHAAWFVEHGKFRWEAVANPLWRDASAVLANACLRHGVRRFVGLGTCYEYDWPDDADCVEFSTPCLAHAPYEGAKIELAAALTALAAENGWSFAWARVFVPYGPGEGEGRLVPTLARAMVRGEAAKLGTGAEIRDFVDARDVGQGIAALALTPVEGPVNIATGRGVSLAELARTIAALAGRPELVEIGARVDRPGEPKRITADVRRLTQEVGYRPRITLERGLADALMAAR